MTGVNLVGIVPEHRGGGTATQLMDAAVREMHASGVPISVLYPAKQTLYRRVGFELAGSRFEHEIALRDLEFEHERGLHVRAFTPEDLPTVQEVHRASCRGLTGPIDRPEYMWRRIYDPLGDREIHGYLVDGDDGCEAYAFVEELPAESLAFRLALTDFVALTGRASRRLLRFFGDHASLGKTLSWFGDPVDLAFMTLREQTWQTKVMFRWMLRILDPAAALAQRGYPDDVEAAIDLELTDPLLEENNGRLRLTVADGRAEVTSGGSGTVRADIRGLAAISTGYLHPAQAKALGLLDGPDDALARAATLFAGGTPWMSDMF
jgi:predicted acetyltransferase